MSISLIVNGQTFEYPENGDTDWGADATEWANAVTSGMLQKSGGSFTLTSEVDFGATYGLKLSYIKSQSVSPSSAGILRLGNNESIGWRNQANSGDLLLKLNTSNRLELDGVNIPTISSTDTLTNKSISGATNTITNVSLTSGITGVLPIANGGTNNSSVLTAGSVLFSNGTQVSQDNAGFFYDISTSRLGINQSSPTNKLHVKDNSSTPVISERNSVSTSFISNFRLYNSDTTANNWSGLSFIGLDSGAVERGFGGIGTQMVSHTAGAIQGDLVFYTGFNTSDFTEKLRIKGDGNIILPTITASRALTTGGSSEISPSATTGTQLGYLSSSTGTTGTNKIVFDTSPTLVTPVLGVATATSINGTSIPSSVTLTKTSDNLSVFAATTSAQLAGVISDETGSGSLVFATSPTLATPTFTTSITGPLNIGGTTTTSTLTLQSTSGVGASGADIILKVGNNGATEAARILNNGRVGIGTAAPSGLLHVSGGRSFFTGNSETFSLGVSYSNGNGIYYLGASNSATPDLIFSQAGGSEKMRLTNAGSLVLGTGALATTATDGFMYIPSCAGAPTGVPTTQTGTVAQVYDTTNNKLYIYNGAWKSVTLA